MEICHPLTRFIDSETVVDLTLLLAEDLPCTWPGHMWYQHKTFSWFSNRGDPAAPLINRSGVGYQTRWLAIDEHTGTHLDAPSHFVAPPHSGLESAAPAGETSIDRVPLNQTMGPASVIDVTTLSEAGEPGCSPLIKAERIREWEHDNGPLKPGDIVLFHTGWDRLYRRGTEGARYGWDVLVNGVEPGWPAPDAECVTYLYEQGVRCVGTDGLSVGAADNGAPAHLAGLTRSMVFVEALTNLSGLPARGAYFLMLTLRIEGGSGGPGRAIAVLPSRDRSG